jgi:hypothetical protein
VVPNTLAAVRNRFRTEYFGESRAFFDTTGISARFLAGVFDTGFVECVFETRGGPRGMHFAVQYDF